MRFSKLCKFTNNILIKNYCSNVLQSRKKNLTSLIFSSNFSSKKLFYENANLYWNDIAVHDRNGAYSYGEIYTKSLRLTESIKSVTGDKKQENVIVLLPNDVFFVVSLFAIWRARHVVVSLHPSHPPSQLQYYIQDSQASVIITNQELANKFELCLSERKVIILEDKQSFLNDERSLEEGKQIAEAKANTKKKEWKQVLRSNALIIYTSGTTGPPKGVVLTHSNLIAQVRCLITAWKWSSMDRILHCLPLNHVHGIVNALLCPLYCGAKVSMEAEFDATSVWLKLLNLNEDLSSRINVFMAVPTMYAKLIQTYNSDLVKENVMWKEFVKRICIENIRVMVSGSAPLPETILKQWEDITGHVLLERYGMTEIGMALSNPLNGPRIPGSVGSPFPGVQVKIATLSPKRDSYETICEGSDGGTQVNPGCKEMVGELLVKGPNVFHSYWKNEEATKKEFTKDGWFCTGDTAVFENGVYKILGRTSVDIIKSGGFKVSALDVERHLLSLKGVVDIAVVGIPDAMWGEKVAALVVWNGTKPLDIEDFRARAKELLPYYQVPSVIKVLPDQIPRNAMGKVNKKQLVKEYFTN